MAQIFNCWTPGRIVDNLLNGRIVPSNWREQLVAAGYVVPEWIVDE